MELDVEKFVIHLKSIIDCVKNQAWSPHVTHTFFMNQTEVCCLLVSENPKHEIKTM